MLTRRQIADRLLKSRRLYWALTIPAGPMRDLEIDLATIQTEVERLKELAREHPEAAKKILELVDQWEKLSINWSTMLN